MSTLAIRAENLTMDYGKVRGLDGLNLEVQAGMIFGFLGPNGAGKTTTIRLLLGLLEPIGGRAEVLGFDTATQASEIRLRSGALLEFNGLYERLSAENNLNFYARVWKMSGSQRKARVRELLEAVGLWDRRKELAGSWSRGMKQKLAVARALLHHPQLVFLDEPTAGLDPVAAVALREELAALAAREGVTVFLTTHNMVEAERLCHQVGIIRQGKLLSVGSMEKLRTEAGGLKVEIVGRRFTPSVLEILRNRREVKHLHANGGGLSLQLNGATEVAPLVSLLVHAGAEIEEVRKGKATLEEAFLALVHDESPPASASQSQFSDAASRGE